MAEMTHDDARKLVDAWSFREPSVDEARSLGAYIDQQESKDAKLAASEAALADMRDVMESLVAVHDGHVRQLLAQRAEAANAALEAEKRAETAERELLLATSDASSAAERVTKWIEQARQEGYERGKAEARGNRVEFSAAPRSHHPTCRCELCERREHDL